ncbi:MAG: hydantoinase/oxoprolinase family protein [Alphaproteobacteria bacterium]|nr:hydantoinase/oxoprolinase family protein [Alphaproteobacteria bacterium]
MTSPHRDAAVAIDIGGTFTDITLLDRRSGRTWNAKTPTTPEDPSIGFMTGIEQALAAAGIAPESLAHVFHGTTVATNLILEGKGATAALITSEGFKHILEIGRHDIPRKANIYAWIKPKRPVPPERVFAVRGRLDHDGSEIVPLDEAAVRTAARRIRDSGAAGIAVCLLHSYANPAHERRVRELILDETPGALVSLSSDVLPVFREYERSMATILNVYVMPAVSSYVARLEERLAARRVHAPLLLMKSNGGVTGATTIRREPVQTALSGPAAGVMGAVHVGALAGQRNLITIDIGGTSADICLIKNGEPAINHQGRIGDWPLHVPMIDINTIGAGGGSLARVDADGNLTVGPRSAGAKPGPACYGRGGVEPTVTDANLLLGRLTPRLLDGGMTLDVEAARRAVTERVARPLGLSPQQAARGMLSIIDNNMVGAIRVVSVERGHDPRDFVLLPFGGAGPLHATSLARLLGIKTILVPPAPGVLSALGLLVSDLRAEFVRTALQQPPHDDVAGMARVFAELEAQAASWFSQEGVPPEGRTIRRQASLRYLHQGFELTVPWHGESVTQANVTATIEAFHALHEQLYTFKQEDMPVEIVTLRVGAIGHLPRPQPVTLPRAGALSDAQIGTQPMDDGEAVLPTPVYARDRLGAGSRIAGPAIITQLDATSVLFRGQVAEVDERGSLLIRES